MTQTSSRKLRVYGGNSQGRYRVILACASLVEFKQATGISRDFASRTGNVEEVELAMANPGTAFQKLFRDLNGPWERRL